MGAFAGPVDEVMAALDDTSADEVVVVAGARGPNVIPVRRSSGVAEPRAVARQARDR